MSDVNSDDWDLDQWEKALSIHVGTTYVCRQCKNLVMVTKGGIGVMELVCCGKPMETVAATDETKREAQS